MKLDNRLICILLSVLIILSAANLLVGLSNSIKINQLQNEKAVIIEEITTAEETTQKPTINFKNTTTEAEKTTEETTTTKNSAPTTEAESTAEATTKEKSDSGICFVTSSGTKYHRSGCSYLKKSSTKMTVQEAKDCGYSPCSRCY